MSNFSLVPANVLWVWNMALLRRQKERSAVESDSWLSHIKLWNAFQDWVDSGMTTVRLHQLRPTEIWFYNWRFEGRIASILSASHDYVIIFMMGHVSCFLVSIAVACTVGVCVSVHRLKRLSAGAIQQFQDIPIWPVSSALSIPSNIGTIRKKTKRRASRGVTSHYRMTFGHKLKDSKGCNPATILQMW